MDRLNAYTFGGVQNVYGMKWFSLGLGADVTLYNVPDRLTFFYGDHPYGVHVFARIRPGGGPFHRMWNMTMTEPMRHSGMTVR